MLKLISDEYRQLNSELHKRNPHYGAQGHKMVGQVMNQVIEKLLPNNALDYGCGKGTLKRELQQLYPQLDVREYDPAIVGKGNDPQPADLVMCLDVMEHIEPECLDDVIAHIRSKTLRCLVVTIATRPAEKFLADGRNAHLIVEPMDWWLENFANRFSAINNMDLSPEAPGRGFVSIMLPK